MDTNVLVYAVDTSEPEKRARAMELLTAEQERIVISPQVLGEFYVTVTRKLSPALSEERASAAVERLSGLSMIVIDAELARNAIGISREAQIS